MYIIGAEGSRFVYNWCGRGLKWGSVFSLGGPPTVQKGPYSVESHLEIAKIETPEILKREPLFSEEKKPENHFFVSKSFARYIMVEGGIFCVRNCQFWTKRDSYFHFWSFFDTFWTILYIIGAEGDRFVNYRCRGEPICELSLQRRADL